MRACPYFELHHALIGTLAVLLSLVLTGCATDADRTRAQGAGAGAVAGGAIGGLLHGRGSDALVGAAIGAVGGLIVGDRVAKKKQAYAKREEALRSAAEHSRLVAESAKSYNQQLQQQIVALRQTQRQLENQRMTTTVRHNLALDNNQKARYLLAQTRQRLNDVHAELESQRAVITAEQQAASKAHEQSPADGMRRVSAGVDDLQNQERSLKVALDQLQQIDNRRMY